ncbi:MAG: hypothetical protein GY865_14085 [candidate division Zixibacteria bacterium]|nr:hypothetical protein [candidate division Zixibacteria bacterium]
MEFEKYLFRTALNSWRIAKYSDGSRVKLIAEHDKRGEAESIEFENIDEYETWIDSIVDDETALYNQALGVKLVLDALTKGGINGINKRFFKC